MIKSIRQRLHWWYGTVYALSIIVFGCLVYWRADREVHDRAVLQAVSTAQYLDVSLRNARPSRLEDRPGQGRENKNAEVALGPLPLEFHYPPPPRGQRRPPPREGGRNRQLPVRPSMDDRPSLAAPPSQDGSDSDEKRPPIDRMDFLVWRPDGTILASSDGPLLESYAEKMPPSVAGPEPKVQVMENVIEATMKGPRDTIILVLRPMQHDVANLHRFGLQILGLGLLTALVGTLGGRWISRKMVQPIQHITATASEISVTSLDSRIDTQKLDEELKPMATVLNHTFSRLEDSFKRLTQFTADASHELRTPLAVIQSQVELALAQPRSQSEYESTLQACLRSSERMRKLVDGLLMLARADSERLELQTNPIDLRPIVEEAVSHLHDACTSKGIELECQTPEDAVRVAGDGVFLLQVPVNLIENAIQHTPRGGVISVELRCEGDEAVLAVRDTGCGIAAEHLPQLFERFYRVDTGRSRSQGGNGLGLAICQSLVVAHGGTIACSSEVDKGSTFTVRLPLLDSKPIQEEPSQTEPS